MCASQMLVRISTRWPATSISLLQQWYRVAHTEQPFRVEFLLQGNQPGKVLWAEPSLRTLVSASIVRVDCEVMVAAGLGE